MINNTTNNTTIRLQCKEDCKTGEVQKI